MRTLNTCSPNRFECLWTHMECRAAQTRAFISLTSLKVVDKEHEVALTHRLSASFRQVLSPGVTGRHTSVLSRTACGF